MFFFLDANERERESLFRGLWVFGELVVLMFCLVNIPWLAGILWKWVSIPWWTPPLSQLRSQFAAKDWDFGGWTHEFLFFFLFVKRPNNCSLHRDREWGLNHQNYVWSIVHCLNPMQFSIVKSSSWMVKIPWTSHIFHRQIPFLNPMFVGFLSHSNQP